MNKSAPFLACGLLMLTSVIMQSASFIIGTNDSLMVGGSPWRDVRSFGAILDGSTDNSAAVQSAINAGTGYVLIPTNSCAIASSISLTNDVILVIPPGVSLKWTGAAAGTMVTSSQSIVLLRSGIIGGGHLNANSLAGYGVRVHSSQQCVFRDFDIQNGTATTVGISMTADSTGTGGFNNNSNSTHNYVSLITAGTAGKLLKIDGDTNVFTLNYFESLAASDVRQTAIDIVKWADNNHFAGQNRFQLTEDNAIGLYINSGGSGTYSVYDNTFETLAVDNFGSVKTNRVGIKLDSSKRTIVDNYFNSPAAEGGAILVVDSLSHRITGYTTDGVMNLNNIAIYQKGAAWVRSDPVWTISDDSSITPEFKAENTATSGQSQVTVKGKTAAGVVVTGEIAAKLGGSVRIGTTSAHSPIFEGGATETFRLATDGSSLQMADGKNITTGTTTGTKIGTTTSMKLGFYNATPIVQPSSGTDTRAALVNLGLLASGGAAQQSPIMDVYTSSGTWTNRTGAQFVNLYVCAAGGGGGSGRKGATNTVRCGGGGGASGGAISALLLAASSVTSTVTITVGTGGAGGGTQSTNSTDGINGGTGGDSSFGTYVVAGGGGGGGGGTATAGAAGVVSATYLSANNGAAASGTGGVGVAGTTSNAAFSGGTGASGGGITSGNSVSAGAAGGASRIQGLAGGTAGSASGNAGNGNAASAGTYFGGSGGGGGGGNGGTGGNGADYSAGGGGGGAGYDSSSNGGAGGNGGNGFVIVVTYF